MLKKQKELNFSPYVDLYDKLIPKDHLFRRINELVDFSFIEEELEKKYCQHNGRVAEPPVRMFKYLLLKCINPLSDADLVERALYDLSYKYFLGINPEDEVIDSSSLSKFRKLRLKDMELLDKLIEETVRIAIDKGIIESKAIIVDATHTKSRYNRHSIREVLLEQSKNLRKTIYGIDEKTKDLMPAKNTEDSIEKEIVYCKKLIETVESMPVVPNLPAVKEKLNLLKETVEDTKEELYKSKDKDAKTGHKTKDSSFFGYKTHIGMTPERIITAATITSGEKPDGPELKELVRKSRKAGIKVETVIGDAAYSGKDNLRLANQKNDDGIENFRLVSKLNPVITNGNKKEIEEGFIYNKDAGTFQCKAGHLADSCRIIKGSGENKNSRYEYSFFVQRCRQCPFKDECNPKCNKAKKYRVTILSDEHKKQKEFQKSEEFKTLAKKRYMIEAKNNELKNVHGYDVSVGNGLYGTKLQGACVIFVTNLKRIMVLMDEKK